MRRTCIGTAALGLLVVCGLLSALVVTPAAANVYATNLKFSASAVNATTPGATVDLSFILNEPADVDSRIDIYRADTNALVRTAVLGAKPRGLTTWTWDLKDNLNVLVPKNIEYYFKVFAKASGYGSWTQISDDNNRLNQFGFPRSVDVNRDPTSQYFGRIYVNEGLGTATVTGRPVTLGVYALNADSTDAVGQGDTAMSGNVAWTGAGSSPFKVKVGPEGKVYISDWADTHGGVWVAPGDLSGDWPALLDPADITGQNGVASPPAIHGSVSSAVVKGKGLNRVLYTVDEDLICANPVDTVNLRSRGSIWAYPIGPLDQRYGQPGTIHWNDYYPSMTNNFDIDLGIDPNGDFWMGMYRSSGIDAFSLAKVAADGNPAGNYALSWRSLTEWGNPDPLRLNRGSVAIDGPRKRMATPAYTNGVVNVFSVDNSWTPIKSTLTTVGGGALLWVGGASTTVRYSANAADAAPTFAVQATPDATTQLNDLAIEETNTAAINGWAVGDGGKIYVRTNNSAWTADISPTASNLNGMVAVWNVGNPVIIHGWAVGDGGVVVNNTGGSWVVDATCPATGKLNAISKRVTSYLGPVYELFAVGDGGAAYKRDTNGVWTTLTTGVTANLNDISVLIFASANATGYAVGNTGTIIKTTDGGATWTPATASGTTANLRGVSAVTSTDVWAVGDGGVIVHTGDGTNWAAQTSGTASNLKAVYFRDNQVGWAVGDGGLVLRTRNGGANWAALTSGTTANLRALTALPTGSGTPRCTAFDAVGNLYVTDNNKELLRVYAPPDGPNEYTTQSLAKFVPTNGDATKPTTPVVTAPPSSSSPTSLSASWTSTGAVSYRYAIGVTADDQNDYVQGWTNTNSTSVTQGSLSLIGGVKYFWYVQGKSANGVWSDVGISGGTLVLPVSKIGQAKQQPANSQVAVENVVVTRSSGTEFWAQEQDRSAGVRVLSTANPPVNTLVSFAGKVQTDATTTEKYIDATGTTVTTGAAFTAVPLGTGNKNAGGNLVTGGTGLADDGLLVNVWGKVTQIPGFPDQTFYLDDGAGVTNDLNDPAKPGVKISVTGSVSFGNWPSATTEFWKVKGIVRLQKVGSTIFRLIDVAEETDISKEN